MAGPATKNRLNGRLNGRPSSNGKTGPRWLAPTRSRAASKETGPARKASSTSSSGGGELPKVHTLLDRAIAWLSPGWARRRIEERLRARALVDYYDGATRGRRGASIRRTLADANSISEATLWALRAGSHDLVRNNPLATKFVQVVTANVVGTGIRPQFIREGGRAEDVEAVAARFLGSTDCDADGRNSYGGLHRLAMRTVAESGEVLVRRRWRRLNDGLEVPVQFQVIEPDFLDETRDTPRMRNGGKIVQGVEFDAIGRRRGYYLYAEHPGSNRRMTSESSFVPASEVLHVYRTDRPGQVRGIPWLAPLMLRLADLADYEDAQLVRQKIAACFVGFWKESFGTSFPGSAEEDGEDIIDTFEPGMFERLPPGAELEFGKPPEVQGYEEYIRVSDRRIAAGGGVSYEALTGDLKNTSFSSGRMGHLEYQRNISEWQTLMIIPQLCAPMARWFLEGLQLAGTDTSGVEVRHVPPRREMIDPTKEVPAEQTAIRAGLKTLTQSLRESGRDPIEHLTELAEDMKLLEELGLELETDVRARPAAPAPPAVDDEEDEDGDEGVDTPE